MRSNNKVLDFLMRQKAEGKIPGILGRLVCLCAVFFFFFFNYIFFVFLIKKCILLNRVIWVR